MPAPPKTQTKAPQKVESKPSKKVEAAPVVAAAPAPVSVAPPAAQTGGKKVVKKVAEVAPVEVAPVEATPVVKKGGAKAKVVAEKVAPVQKAAGKKVAGKKAAAPKVEKAAKAPKVKKEVVADAEGEAEDDAKGIRSFKVQLPGSEDYSGRFTGLTPYQAANKALSKYFRENKQAKTEITFSIRESTRGSKRSTYTYNGKREKLVVPVKYSIKSSDGVAREITKEYKNKLIKVKKGDVNEASA